ncbi:MAG: hypothetical protein C0621_00030 [Desulfuromonas sp.]|nr:MAG: hypothetical protein C0621_00030 [Desulfuromonas sp.]
MTRFALTCLLALSLATPAVAVEGGFWNNLKGRLDKVTPTRKPAMTTAVGGVRGSLETPAAQLYWKGEALPLEMDEAEMQAFNDAVTAADQEDSDHAITLFEAFIELYPQSPLQADARKAIALLAPPPLPTSEMPEAITPVAADEAAPAGQLTAAEGIPETTAPAVEEAESLPVAAAEPAEPGATEIAVDTPAPIVEETPAATPAETPAEPAAIAPATVENSQI